MIKPEYLFEIEGAMFKVSTWTVWTASKLAKLWVGKESKLVFKQQVTECERCKIYLSKCYCDKLD